MRATRLNMVSLSPPGSKKRGKLKNFEYDEPMVLIPAVPAESVAQYCIALPSTTKDKVLDEMDMLKNITEHLNEIVYTMEQVYTKTDVIKEEDEDEEEEPTTSKEDQDMTTFLICCSQLSIQLENALREEKQILESLLKWFEKEVHEMEEMGEEEIIPDWQIPVADKNITENISKLLNRIQRLEELKGRVQELPKLIQVSTPKQEKKRLVSPLPPATKDPKNIIEELAMKHATEDVMNMVQVFQDDTGQPQTVETLNNRMVEIMKVFERQTNKLHRVANEQDVLEGKLQKIQKEFRKLAEEKEIMEEELQKMKNSEQEKMMPEARKKMLAKLEKGKVEPPASAEKAPMAPKKDFLPSKQKENQKMKEDLAKAQANVQSLEEEKKMLEEKLKRALEEAEMAKGQLAEIPPHIPDWQMTYTAIEEDDKDVPKKGKKGKVKVKGEDRTDLKRQSTSGTDRSILKQQKTEMGKAGESFPRKSQDLSTVPPIKDAKHKRKGSVYPDGPSDAYEKELSKQTTQSEGTSRIADKKMEDSKKMKAKTEGKSETVDSKGVAKSKEPAETKKTRSTIKGIGKETPLEPPTLPHMQEEQELSDSTKEKKKTMLETLDKSPEKMLPPDSKRRKKEITTSPESIIEEKGESLYVHEQKPSPPLAKFEVEDSAEPIKPTEEMERISATTTPEKPLILEKRLSKIHTDAVEPGEDEIKDLLSEKMLQLADHLTDLEGMPEAETLAKLLLEPGQGLKELSDQQKLQILNQLIPPDELQQTGEIENERKEKKRSLFANLTTTLQILQEIPSVEAGLSEEEMNEVAEKRRDLLANLESDLKEAMAATPDQQDIDREINKLSEERTLLLANLELNMKDLEQAQALAVTQPSEMSENKVKELLQQRELLEANLEANMQELQRTKTLAAGLPEKYMHDKEHTFELNEQRQHLFSDLTATLGDLEEKQRRGSERAAFVRLNEQELYELYGLSGKKQELLEKLESNQKELQEAQALSASQPGSVIEHKLQELAEQRRILTAELESTADDIQNVYHHASERTFLQPAEREVYELSVKKAELLDKLESNKKELQEAQALAIAQPGSISDYKLQKLIEERRGLATDLEKTTQKLQKAQDLALEGHAISQPSERALYELSEKKQELLGKLKANQKELQEAQELGAMHPGAISEQKLQELAEQRRYLTEELEGMEHDILEAERRVSERAVIGKPSEKELYELMVTKQELQKKLKSNQKELEEAQFLAAMHPGSISEHKLQELAEQRKHLSDDLKRTESNIQKASKKSLLESVERELYELSEKKQAIEASLESNWKELQQLQDLVATRPDSITELRLQELTEERRFLTEDLEATMHDIQKAERRVSEATKAEQMIDRELHDLFKKKHMLQSNLQSNWEKLQEAQVLKTTQPDSISEQQLQELAAERRCLTEDLDQTVMDIIKAQRFASEKSLIEKPGEKELYELSEKKQLLLENLKDLQEAQALAATQRGSVGDFRRKQLDEQRRHLAEDLEATVHDIQKLQHLAPEITVTVKPSERELFELSEKKYLLLEKLASNRKELQEAQALAASQPGSVSDSKLQEIAEQRRRLTEDLKATLHTIQEMQHRPSLADLTGRSREKELYELSEKKQMLLKALESKRNELQEAEALAAAQPGSISVHKLQVLDEQRRQLLIDLEATIQDIEEIQHDASQREKELYELSEKKQILLESLESKEKELQEAETLAVTHPGIISEHKLQELDEQRRHLTTELEATVHNIQNILDRASPRTLTGRAGERELYELSEKKQMLLKSLESKKKELQEAEALAAAQPGSISEHKLQELDEQRRHLTTELEATVHDMQEIQHRASPGTLTRSSDRKALHELSLWKQFLLESLESNVKLLDDAHALEATQPGSISEKKMKELNEQRRILTEDLKAVVQDVQEMKLSISGAGGKFTPITQYLGMDLNELYRKKKWVLECLELNRKHLRAAQTLAATHPSSINEQKVQELTEQRRLLAAGLDAIIQDVHDIVSFAPEKIGSKSRERILEELSEKKKQFLENLASNLKALKEAQALADVQHNDVNEQKVQELIEERRLLTAGLQKIMKEMKQLQDLLSTRLEIPTPSERELAELSEKRRLVWENMEKNVEELKALQAIVNNLSGSTNQQKMKELAEKRTLLTTYLETVLQDIQSFDSDKYVMTRLDGRKINDLIELSRLESKLDELEETGFFPDIQLSSLKRKVHELKEQRGNLIDKWELLLLEEYPETYGLDRVKDKTIQEFLDQRKHLFSYLQSSIRDLQKRGIIQQGSMQEAIQEVSDDHHPLGLLKSEAAALSAKYGSDDEKIAKQRVLAAKLEANIKDLQTAFEIQKIEKPKYLARRDSAQGRSRVSITESSDQQLKPLVSELQIQITKPPVVRKFKPDSISPSQRTGIELNTSAKEKQEKNFKKEIELALKRQFMQQLPGNYYQQSTVNQSSFPLLVSPIQREVNANKLPIEYSLQNILDYNKNLLPAHRANLQQALQLAQHQLLQQQTNSLSERIKDVAIFGLQQPPAITRFHEYSIQSSRPGFVWEGSQLPRRDYVPKLNILRKKLLGLDMKDNLTPQKGGAPPLPIQGPNILANKDQDSIVICGKGCNPFKKFGKFSVRNN